MSAAASTRSHAGRLALAETRIALLDQRITFMVNALSVVLAEYGIDPARAQQEPARAQQEPGAVKPLVAVKGGGCRSAPRRPGLHLVQEEEQ